MHKAPAVPFDASLYETRQVFFASKDGTRVPMFVTHRKGIALDGSNPVLLYAYGGFNVSLLPAFAPERIAWIEAGGIYAQPNLRGGAEYGEAWHQAGMLDEEAERVRRLHRGRGIPGAREIHDAKPPGRSKARRTAGCW